MKLKNKTCYKKILLVLLGIWLVVSSIWGGVALAEDNNKKWVVYYTDIADPKVFSGYDVIAFDGDHHPDLRPLLNEGKTLLGYISFSEAAEYRSFYKKMKAKKLLFKIGDGKEYIDIRNPEWIKMIIEDIIPDLVHKGFNGIIIDTLDSSIALELRNPVKYGGMIESASQMIKAIRIHYPYLKIMLNRAFNLVPVVGGDIDMLLAESVMVRANFNENTYSPYSQDDYNNMLDWMKAGKKKWPKLEVYSLDYWDMKDEKGVADIYSRQRDNGFIPYVASPDLQHVYKEPK